MKREDFKSNEEFWFYNWLLELKDYEYVSSITYEPETFVLCDQQKVKWKKQLKTKEKEMEYTIQNELVYTPDFVVDFTDKADGVITFNSENAYKTRPLFYSNDNRLYFEVKSDWDYKNMNRVARDRVAWLKTRYGFSVEVIKVQSLLKKTFYPDVYFYTEKGNPRKNKSKKLLKNILPNINTYINEPEQIESKK